MTAFDAVSSVSASTGTTLTVAHTCTGADRVLIVDAAIGASNKAQAVTYNGVAMTSLGERHSNDSTSGKIEKFILIAPASGTNNIEYTRAAGGAGITMILGGVSFNGASQTLADYTGHFFAAAGNTTAPTLAVTGTTSGSIIQDGVCNGSPIDAAGAGQTQRWQIDADANSAAGNAGGSTEPGNGGTVTMSWTATSDWWAIQAVEILTAAAGGVSLVVDSASHAHTADAAALTQAHALAVADATHAHTADSPTPTQAHVLAVADALHAHTADEVAPTQAHTLLVADTLHGHIVDNVTLDSAATLGIHDALHAHIADGLTLTQLHVLAVQDALHAHSADELQLAQMHVLGVADATHAHSADEVVLVVVGAIQPDPNPLRVVFAENLAPTTAESRAGVYTEGHHLVYQE